METTETVVRAEASKPKRAYRYRITGVGGGMVGKITEGEHLLEWSWFGRSHTWSVFNLVRGEETGWYSGVYLDKGYLADRKYLSDAEIASATAALPPPASPSVVAAPPEEQDP